MVAVTSLLGVADPLRITLFGAGACFFGALFVTDPQRGERIRTLGWATVVTALAVVATVYLSRTGVWAAAAFLLLMMFLSFALRSRSTRAGNLAAIGALTAFSAGAGHITADRIGWFVIASTVGFAWLAIWQLLILPDYPVRSLKRSVHVIRRQAADVVANVVDVVKQANDGNSPNRAGRALRPSLDRVRSCRTVIDNQLTGGLAPNGFGQHDVEQLRVTLYTAQRGLEQIVDQVTDPRWTTTLPDDVARSITSNLQTLAAALRDDVNAQSIDTVARDAQLLRDQLRALARAAKAGDAAHVPADTVLAAITIAGGAELVAESISDAQRLPTGTPEPAAAAALEPDDRAAQAAGLGSLTPQRALQPTMALGLQAVVAAVAAGLIAEALGNEQSRVVAFTAFLIIAGSAEESIRRAWARLGATILGATGGVVIAASIPQNIVLVVAVVTVGVFFTIFTAPVSYAGMVFWITITLVALFASEGLYLHLVIDKAVAALIGGCVAAAVALSIAPIRLSRDFRPAVLQYLDALDEALECHLPGHSDRSAKTESALERARSALDSIVAKAATEIHLFPHSGDQLSEQAVRIDAVHEAFLRLTPVLADSPRRLLGWTDEQTENVIHHLRDDVETAKAAARGDQALVNTTGQKDERPSRLVIPPSARREMDDALWRIENLHARLIELALALDCQPRSPTGEH
jgi:uncharacterized membrane protein YgaE (UPF0421/DUF939 family)